MSDDNARPIPPGPGQLATQKGGVRLIVKKWQHDWVWGGSASSHYVVRAVPSLVVTGERMAEGLSPSTRKGGE